MIGTRILPPPHAAASFLPAVNAGGSAYLICLTFLSSYSPDQAHAASTVFPSGNGFSSAAAGASCARTRSSATVRRLRHPAARQIRLVCPEGLSFPTVM